MTDSMAPQSDTVTEDDPRILQISREYLTELESGAKPDRQPYLDRFPELRELVSDCLDGVELAHSLRPPPLTQDPISYDLSLASPLGDFQIVKEIGRGGMGVVYEAIQISLGRRVALKVLPFATALDNKRLQRFKTEAYAAAQLHHSHIVPVHAVGCERGMHFYAMQLIEGHSLSEVIEEQRRQRAESHSSPSDASAPRAATTVAAAAQTTVGDLARTGHRVRMRDQFRNAATLIAEVADALEYAHDAGVIHRDIKPANLLLDFKGTVWVTDFGLAQVATDVSLTQTGDLVGTLRYMSPEQAGGGRQLVDHRTDIYSLGATLYEVLTLQPIFTSQDRSTLLQQILRDDPRPPRDLDRAIPIELETIVLKSLSKLPQERYATAGDMAADLRRFLNEIPIRARRPQVIDRVRKWMRRHPSFVIASVVMLLLCSLVLSITTAIISREHSKTEQAYQNELLRAQEAETQFKLARSVADEMIQLADEELGDQPFQEGLRKRLLESALKYYQEFIARRPTTSVAVSELAATRDRVETILEELNLLQADRHLFLLQHEAVLDDLELTATQRQGVRELQDQFDIGPFRPDDGRPGHPERRGAEPRGPGPAHQHSQLTPKAFRQEILKQARLKEVAFATILSPQQRERLTEIALQCQGPMAFREIDLARRLELTTEQKEQINLMIAEFFFQPGPRRYIPEQERNEKARQAVQQILLLLQPRQRQQWSELTGKPFLGAIPHPFFGGGPGKGGGPGPHPDGFRGPRPLGPPGHGREGGRPPAGEPPRD